MSQQDVDCVREWVSTWTGQELIAVAAEPESMASWFEMIHPEFEGRWAGELPDVETHRGLEGAERMAREWLAPWEEYRQDPVEFIDAGECVVVAYRCLGRGRESGADVEMSVTHVYTVREGKIASLHEYMSRAEALEAAGAPK